MGNDLNHRRGPVVAVVQARMGSTRLPGKVLADIGGWTVLELVLRRLSRARGLDAIVVATSTDSSDDPVLEEAQRLGFGVVRGSSHDVLGRYVDACNQTRAEAVVRITADCPLIDPDVTDQVVRRWHDERVDYASNIAEPRSYPDGLDVEAIASGALRRADQLAGDPGDREHVTPYIRRHPELFSATECRLEPSHSDVRITLDTPEDLRVIRELVDRVGPDASLADILGGLGLPASAPVPRR